MRWRYERCGNERTKMSFNQLQLWILSSITASDHFVCIQCLDQDSFNIRKRIRATVFLQNFDLNLRIQGLKGAITNLPKIDSSGCRMGRLPSQRVSTQIAPLKSEFWDFKSEFSQTNCEKQCQNGGPFETIMTKSHQKLPSKHQKSPPKNPYIEEAATT